MHPIGPPAASCQHAVLSIFSAQFRIKVYLAKQNLTQHTIAIVITIITAPPTHKATISTENEQVKVSLHTTSR